MPKFTVIEGGKKGGVPAPNVVPLLSRFEETVAAVMSDDARMVAHHRELFGCEPTEEDRLWHARDVATILLGSALPARLPDPDGAA